MPTVLTPTALCPQPLSHCSRHILSPRPTRTQRGNSRHGLKNTLQMLLLGLFISCFKQLYFGLAPSQALSVGITACCTGIICSAPCLAAQEVGVGQFGKANAHLKASQPGGSTARARASIWKRSKAPLAAGRGVSWWLPACHRFPRSAGQGASAGAAAAAALGRGRSGGAASLQLDQGVANTLGRASSAVGTQPLSELAFVGTPLLRVPAKSCGSGVVGDAGLYQAALLWGRAVRFPLPGSALEPPAHGDGLRADSEAPDRFTLE